jgi:hypothetical protein
VDCEQAVSLICARLDGELRREDQSGLEAHLASCPGCRATAEAVALQDGDLRRAFGPRRRAAALRAMQVADRVVTRPPRARFRPDRALIRLAALVAGVAAAGVWIFLLNHGDPSRPTVTAPLPGKPPELAAESSLGRLEPRPLIQGPGAVELAAGQTVETRAGERRRFALSGGGVLYLDQNTRFQSGAAGQGTLTSGRICLAGGNMTVTTADRTVVFAGGRGEVWSDGKQSGVLVASGVAVVLPRDSAGPTATARLSSGDELLPGAWQATAAPRATARLDWTRDLVAEGEAPLVPASSYAGGALIAVDANGQEAKLSLRKYHIDVHIEDGFARTTIDQTYFNHHPWRLEGTFFFPLPPDASLSRLAMYVDGNLMEGGMAEREHAARVYQQIVSSQRDPALLEWVDGSTFKMRVFPLEGRQEKRIILSYTQRLPDLYGKTTYRFPSGHSLQVVRDWSFVARVKGAVGLLWGSPTYPSMRCAADGPDLLLSDTETNVTADRDVVLELDSGRQTQPGKEARFVSAELDGRRYLMLRYRPTLASPAVASPTPREWVFLCESSADRDPLVARAQIEVIRHMLTEAGPADTFNVLTAGTRTFSFATSPQPVTPERIAAAADFLGKTHLIGALDLGRAFDDAAKLVLGNNAWLVHVGSGYTAMGVRQEDLSKHLPAGARYVGIGVGKSWNRSFMKDLAERTSGHFTQINPDESIAWRALDVMATLNAPRLLGVTVEAPAGQPGPVFLTDVSTVCQGEELCAVARLSAENGSPLSMPAEVTVRGKLDGMPFSATLPVPGAVPGGAGYVPRTWAKLEIERLLAADARANHVRVVALSKAMYVMSPFTSLLVLENEAMYAQFKVDRGRKDHWAMYPCPPKVPVVYEPEPGQPVDVRNAPKGPKPQAELVRQTVLVRPGPSFRGRPAGEVAYFPPSLALVVKGTGRTQTRSIPPIRVNNTDYYSYQSTQNTSTDLGSLRSPDLFWIDVDSPIPVWNRSRGLVAPFVTDLDGRLNVNAGGDVRNLPGRLSSNQGFGTWELPKDWNPVFDPITGRSVNFGDAISIQLEPPGSARLFRLEAEDDLRKRWREELRESNTGSLIFGVGINSDTGLNGSLVLNDKTREGPLSLGLERPTDLPLDFGKDGRLFTDLVAHSPGLNTSPADLRAVLEEEATPDLRAAPGHVEPEARRLINAARSGGWQALTITSEKGREDFTLTFDGAGRFVFQWTNPIGLREHVVCDGNELLHLYPELGVGARRTVSRFHRAELVEMLPWLVPPAEDLARGADVRLVDDHTVAVVPNGDKPARALHLVFDAGRLAERQIVDSASKKVLAREVYGVNGAVRCLDAEGKELGKRQYTVRAAKAPDLKPDTSALVLLPLPFRSPQHVFAKYLLSVERPLADEVNGCYTSLDADKVAELLAVAVATRNQFDARTLYDGYYGPRGDRRHGLFTLLAASGTDVSSIDAFRRELSAHPDDPLLRYLRLQESKLYDGALNYLPLQAGEMVGGNGILHRLAILHDLKRRWESRPLPGTAEAVRRVDAERTFAFVRQNLDWPPVRALLAHVQDKFDHDLKWLAAELAEARGLVAARGGAYVDYYEQARLLFIAGRKAEAADRFLELYARESRGGALPRFDGSLREALLDGDRWGQLMRQTAAGLVKEKRRPDAVALAAQCREAGDAPLADNLLSLALEGAAEDERLSVTLAAVWYLRRAESPRRADELLRILTANEPFAADSRLWRLRSAVEAEMGQQDESVVSLERALDLEFRNLPAVIDLNSWRADYGRVLDHLQGLASAARTLGAKPPPDLAGRTVRAADHWRSHDPEAAAACEKAAATLANLGAADLAWDYLTTATALPAPTQTAWGKLGAVRHAVGDLDTAERAYAVACAGEPGDALLLWDRAQNLRQAGRTAEADALLRKLADGQWPAQFAPLRELARSQLAGH